MLTCIACTKQLGGGTAIADRRDEDETAATPSSKHAIKALTAQIKDMALKASGAYRHCKPCSGGSRQGGGYADSDAVSGSERFHYSYRRATNGCSTPRTLDKEIKGGSGLSSGDRTPSVMSGRTDQSEPTVVLLEEEAKEWVAQVEPGVLITFLSLPQGGNDLKRIRFSRELFNKWQAQRWWAENFDKVMELYNVQRFNHQAVPLPATPRSEDESSKMESAEEESPMTPPLSKERLPRSIHRPAGMGYSSSDSLDHQSVPNHSRHYYVSGAPLTTPKLSSISGAKTDVSSMDASIRTSSSREADRSGELSVSVSNASELEAEWVEQDEPGVYITIRALPGGTRELRRVRFSRERFSEMHARVWWEENRARIHEQYL